MKKIILFALVAMFVASCSIDDEQDITFNNVLVPVESVNIPDTLVFEETYSFEITYERASTCHSFAGFSYHKNGRERTIGVVNTVYYNVNNCENLEDETQTENLAFEVVLEDFYIFKFWQGTDENGNDTFLTKEVPVKIE
jgi:hypothetical protein